MRVLALSASDGMILATRGLVLNKTWPALLPQEDLEQVRIAGQGRVDITVGSALDIFGGKLRYEDVVAWHAAQQAAAKHQGMKGA
jgi:hypothetical protein